MTQDSPELQKLKKRILALIAKSEGTDNEHEAATFAAKARALMEEHQLTMAQLDQAQDALGRTMVILPYNDACYIQLAAAAAHYLGCFALLTKAWGTKKNPQNAIIFVGRASARAVAEIMTPFWLRTAIRAGQRLHRDRGLRSHPRQSVAEVVTAFGWRLAQLQPLIAAQQTEESRKYAVEENGGEYKDSKKRKQTRVHVDALARANTLPVDMQLG